MVWVYREVRKHVGLPDFSFSQENQYDMAYQGLLNIIFNGGSVSPLTKSCSVTKVVHTSQTVSP
jgi:hypothetical protein